VNYVEPTGESHLLGLLVEQATETIRRDADDFVDAGVAVDGAPYLGPVTTDEHGMIQRIELNRLLPSPVRDQLFRKPVEFS
jgi:chemotaxis-related protein WspB